MENNQTYNSRFTADEIENAVAIALSIANHTGLPRGTGRGNILILSIDADTLSKDGERIPTSETVYKAISAARTVTKLLTFKGTVPSKSDLPAGSDVGDVYLVVDEEESYAWDGSYWESIGKLLSPAVESVNGKAGVVELSASDIGAVSVEGGTMDGDLSMGGHRITDLAQPEDDGDAATKGYTDTKASLPKTASGTIIALSDASDGPLQGLRVYGRTTQDGTPTPENPVELVSVGAGGNITVSVGTSQEDANPQTMTLSTPNGLPGIPVDSGGNYTDEAGQQWICDEIDLARGMHTKRIYEYVFAGTENLKVDGSGKIISITFSSLKIPAIRVNNPDSAQNLSNAMCNRALVGTQNNVSNGTKGVSFQRWGSNFYAGFSVAIFGEADSLKAAMQAAYADGNPYTIIYELETPIETALSDEELAAYAALHTNAPNTTVYNDAGAHMDVDYYPPDATMRREDIMDALDNASNAAMAYVDAKHFIATVSLSAASWAGDTAPYNQTVLVPGVLVTDFPHVTPVYSSTLATALAQKEAWAMVNQGVPGAGEITFTCFEDKPETAIPIQIEVNR